MERDPVATNPDLYRVVFGNERVRLLECRDRPGERTTPHGHPDSVMFVELKGTSEASGAPEAGRLGPDMGT